MSFACLLGRHRPLLASIARHGARLDGLCDDCGRPLTKDEGGRWAPLPPLVRGRDRYRIPPQRL